MAKYDVCRDRSGDGLLLEVQTDLLSGLNTRVVVPLLPRASAPTPAARLNPVFTVKGEQVVMVTQFVAAVPVGILGEKITSLADHFDQITQAVDMLIQGF